MFLVTMRYKENGILSDMNYCGRACLIVESREKDWIIRSSRIMTTIGTEIAMNYPG